MSRQENNDLMAQLAALLGGHDPVKFTRIEFSDTTRAFVGYNAEGQGWGGNINDTGITLDKVKENLIKDAESGALGQHFAIYEPVPSDVLAEKVSLASDWKTIFTA